MMVVLRKKLLGRPLKKRGKSPGAVVQGREIEPRAEADRGQRNTCEAHRRKLQTANEEFPEHQRGSFRALTRSLTSKEELQSTNEDWVTQLRAASTSDQLTETSNDVNNLLPLRKCQRLPRYGPAHLKGSLRDD